MNASSLRLLFNFLIERKSLKLPILYAFDASVKLLGLRAVIFDLDGTLINSSINIKEMKRSLLEYIYRLGFRDHSLTPKNTTVEIVRATLDYLKKKGASSDDVKKVMGEINEMMDKFELENVENASPVDDASAVLREIKEMGLKIGVLTRGCEEYTLKSLQVTGMLKYIDAIEARCDLMLAKPNPVSLFNLCSKLKLKIHEVLFVGDHPLDVECAVKAGVEIVGIADSQPKMENLRKANCKVILGSLKDLLPLLKERINREL